MSGYDFSALSPSDFERLVCDALNAKLDLNLRTYPEGRDQGIDLREVTSDGKTIIGQCKHYARTGTKKFLDAIEAETLKSGYKTADRYLLATTHPMSPALEASVAKTLAIPISDVWGPTALNDLLREHPKIVKIHFKLWLS
ncbi:restriction endonuclease, partial [Nonomuraea sp. NPDC055795]